MLIDAHHHLWHPEHRAYPWLTGAALKPIMKAYSVDDLRVATAGQVDHTVLVQTVGEHAETVEFLATASASAGLIAGVVGWVDLTAPDVPEQIARLRAAPGGQLLVGVRHQVQDERDPAWLSRPEVLRGIRAVGAAGLVFDLLVLTSHLERARSVVAALPEVSFVLDHLAKPPIADGGWQPWALRLANLAELPNVTAKISGLVTEARWDGWEPSQIAPYAELAFEVFGAHRLMFGSDWPVCTLAARYPDVLDLAERLVSGASDAERSAFFAGTAQRVYRI